jgi:hypothetical protein
MSFTTDEILTIQKRMAGAGNVRPPLDLVRVLALLKGNDNLSTVLCHPKADPPTGTKWSVVALLDSGCLCTVEARSQGGEGDSVSELSAEICSLSDVTRLDLLSPPMPARQGWAGFSETWVVRWGGVASMDLLLSSDDTHGDPGAMGAIVDKVKQALGMNLPQKRRGKRHEE